MTTIDIVVCHGDQTGEELLQQALRVLEPSTIGLPIRLLHFDLSLEERRRSNNAVVGAAADAMIDTGLGLKAATITPEGIDDVGTPNRILREHIGGTVIVRTGRRIPGVNPVAPITHPITVVRMAVGGAYGAAEARTGTPGAPGEQATRTEVITRSTCRSVAEYSFLAAGANDGIVYGGPKWTVSPTYEGMLKEELDAAAARHPDVAYRPMLIDATYATLMTGLPDQPITIPTLNRDGDCMSDLVLAMYGSIAGAESLVIALDDELAPKVVMAEAPHGTAPTLHNRNLANPMAMLLACAALLDSAATRHPGTPSVAARLRSAILDTAADGVRTIDLGGSTSTSAVVDAVIATLHHVEGSTQQRGRGQAP